MFEIIADAKVVNIFGIFDLDFVVAAKRKCERTALRQLVGATDHRTEIVHDIVVFFIQTKEEFRGGEQFDGLAEKVVLELEPPAEVGLWVELVVAAPLVVKSALYPRTHPDLELLDTLGVGEGGLDAPTVLVIAPFVAQQVESRRADLQPLLPERVVHARPDPQPVEVREVLVEPQLPVQTELQPLHHLFLILRTNHGTDLVRLPFCCKGKTQDEENQYVGDAFQEMSFLLFHKILVLHHGVDGVGFVADGLVMHFQVRHVTQEVDVPDFDLVDGESGAFLQVGFQLLFATVFDEVNLVIKDDFGRGLFRSENAVNDTYDNHYQYVD